MNILFLMDPLETVNIYKDTTYVLMKECQKRGYRIYYLAQGACNLKADGVSFSCTEVKVTGHEEPVFELLSSALLHESDVDAVFIRKDPPFDDAYLADMWVLERVSSSVKLYNSPRGIRTVNEKIWATQFKDLIPDTLISSSYDEIKSFLSKHKRVVLKPINGFGGQGIFIVEDGNQNLGVILETLTQNQHSYIIAQEYLAESVEGDKRILLLNGDAIGAVLRKHGDEDPRNNFFAGGSALKAEVTVEDKRIIDVLKPYLLELGLAFVGIDIIGGKLIEVNVTSPTCVQEINALNAVCLEEQIIAELL